MAGRQMTPLGKEIKKKLIDKGMTQVQLAGMVGTKKAYISKIIWGLRPGTKYLSRICGILGIDPEKYSDAA